MSSEPPTKKAKHDTDMFHMDRLKVAASASEFEFNKKRVKLLTGSEDYLKQGCKAIGYYMHREQRVQDNWAMIYAQKLALEHNLPLHVVNMISIKHPEDAGATERAVQFSLEGLEEVAKTLKEYNVAFHLLLAQDISEPGKEITDWMSKVDIGCLVVDFSPLRPHRSIIKQLVKSAADEKRSIYQVDAHNVVPVTVTSEKQEYAARTIRSKINGKLDEFLTNFPPVIPHPHGNAGKTVRYFAGKSGVDVEEDWEGVLEALNLDSSVKPVKGIKGGTEAGFECLQSFVDTRIKFYNDKRNDPNAKALSDMSPWFHMGNVSVQRAVLYVKKRASKYSSVFIEEAVVRRELSDNFCFYNSNYDKLEGASDWARKTLNDHRTDKRSYVYSRETLEKAETHDDLWNAAQLQLVKEGKMHGFMRMYWAKKILEWTASPEDALNDAIYFNDHYSLDGNDPNGFVGCMWSVCGIHDQGWAERPVFGKIRYMNYAGCKRKFDIKTYIAKHGGKVH